MECSLNFPVIYHRADGHAKTAAGVRMIRLAGFRHCIQSSQIGPHLVQPLSAGPWRPRQNQCQPPEHGRTVPQMSVYGSNRAFSSRGAMFPSAKCRSRMPAIQGEPCVHANRATDSGLRHRGSPARARRCVRAMGAGSRAVDQRASNATRRRVPPPTGSRGRSCAWRSRNGCAGTAASSAARR